jgi:hypothetical protein
MPYSSIDCTTTVPYMTARALDLCSLPRPAPRADEGMYARDDFVYWGFSLEGLPGSQRSPAVAGLR